MVEVAEKQIEQLYRVIVVVTIYALHVYLLRKCPIILIANWKFIVDYHFYLHLNGEQQSARI